ncbi:MAG TPA: biotin carboxylase N-terminal domain-containing protein, partial [Solirubrobacter sp.]
MFSSVLVANRGEIARRVIRTLRASGIRSVAIYTDADAGAPHVREADQAIRVGSYLSIDDVVAAAAGVDALHPGYGFPSENAGLARACAAAGVVFVGPSADAIELMGDKVRAKAAAAAAGVPVVESLSVDEARVSGAYPLLVKAAAGGGGRGMRVVETPEGLDEAIAAAQREAAAGFGDDRVFIERFLPRARHIEVQVIGDAHGNVLSLGERECSLQRRHQKVLEESPSPVVSPELRARLGEEAVALAKAAGYSGAGTVEFIADADDPSVHFFLEMNARLQVEHPVTELVTGLDLVELQLRVAAGEALDVEVSLSGHAIEARINAEDAQFFPSAGAVVLAHYPEGVRVDAAVETGSVVGTDYDSMIAKVIAYGPDRATALARLDRALAETAILGLTTNTGFLRALLAREDVRAGELDTGL